MTKIGVIQFLFLFLISAAYGQKVKYKDIYALLSTKQFEQAEPFLKQYLLVTTDNPNAFLFMGNIFQDKASKNDVLKQTSLSIANMDSAILFYDKAYKTIDDREVRRNKDYYQNYNRRDLRSGEFGVKLSDIQFDLEKRIESLKERIDKVRMVKHFFALADSSYRKANTLYLALQSKFDSQNQLYLRSDAQTLKDLSTLSVRFDSCMKAFQSYQAATSALGKTGYNQKLEIAEISDFKADGRGAADFYQEGVRLWNYKKFADQSREVIEKEIIPMRSHLVTYDMEINKLRDKLNSDSVSVRNDLTKLIDRLLYDELKKFDAQPLPMLVFAMKTTDLEYRSTLLEHKSLRDSADLHFQVAILTKELKLLNKLDSSAAIISDEKLPDRCADYAEFVGTTYGNASTLQSYLRTLREFGAREEKRKSAVLDAFTKGLNYIVDGADSIPLSTDIVSAFRPLVVTPEKFTLGLSLQDTTQIKGYFYTISSSRKPEVKAYFPVDKSAFHAKNISNAHALTYSDAGGQIFYVLLYSEKAIQSKFPTTVAKIYRSDGLAWKVDHRLAFTPEELILSAETGELLIKNGSQQVVLDKNGKMK
ncbi:MAG: hypothetical protein M3Y60_07725 [Bacteroidota bacterium]|nr:hypothetical protein [Bacteroidota bacterium]